jgi:hypothetical protein
VVHLSVQSDAGSCLTVRDGRRAAVRGIARAGASFSRVRPTGYRPSIRACPAAIRSTWRRLE